MAFLTQTELITVAPLEIVKLINNDDENITDEIITESIDIMKSYLFKYYDTKKIFEAESDARSKVILKYLKDIVIHEIYKRRSSRYNETAKADYDEAMLWLDKVAKGSIDVDLPTNNEDEDNQNASSFMRTGGRKSYRNHW
ncbi:phage protein Gp36 family protein [Weeksella virosa]|uniref:DUF1320 domain-containing protein n=1 Tax=Weeksella virosa (strain ATCC 43766 / DSM 16922 / JCM 21250 / CCUG 30538 / CDC 9751 / IAM 14551 / NBRC 16016 / NCTC 11634 / CL345/78) TaxID=865938 RepID=F0P2V6_WEEVC|nr:phage protein Gp36 family protein [Weeksella virosa]ADX66846.1 hypothetical protein Weevi_0120 [Weeksella virosa DSM 16922]MDK7675094.1 DUF1320 family protein [Weeksella virosa]VEH63430.1 Mu-like prophage protein gp36 [Weeksella virosa]